MRKPLNLHSAFLALCLLGTASCSEDYTFTPPKIAGVDFDPSKAVKVDKILPDSGVYLTQFVIKGSNFGTDKSKITVLFNGTRKATVVNTNGTEIYGITPKQDDGLNTVAVSYDGGEPALMDGAFKYTKKEQVNVLTGGGQGYVDGTLAESKFGYMHGVGVLAGNNIVVADGRNNNRVRLISPDEDKVTTLLTNTWCAKPAVTKDRKTFYMCTKASPHAVYEFKQENGWVPKRLTKNIAGFSGEIYSMALDDTEEWLYVRDGKRVFGRMNIADPSIVEILNEECGEGSSETSYLIWNPFDKQFYLSVQSMGGIYTVSNDGKTVEQYAGFNGLATLDGPRLEAQFVNPVGMAQDLDGNLYVIDSGQHILRKIDRITGMVSVVVGRAGTAGDTDGDPLDARLNWPYDVACDDEGNFYIAEGWGDKVKKYAIE